MEKEIYKMIDRFLIALEEVEHGKGIRIPFDRSSPKGRIAIQLMMKYDLADFRTSQIEAIGLVYKNLNGIKILEIEGFEKWINAKNFKESTKEFLEIRKLELDVKNAQRIYDTYWITFGIAIFGLIIAVIALWLQLSKPAQQDTVKQQSVVKPANVSK